MRTFDVRGLLSCMRGIVGFLPNVLRGDASPRSLHWLGVPCLYVVIASTDPNLQRHFLMRRNPIGNRVCPHLPHLRLTR